MLGSLTRKIIYSTFLPTVSVASEIIDSKIPGTTTVGISGLENLIESNQIHDASIVYAIGGHRSIKEGVKVFDVLRKNADVCLIGKYYLGPIMTGVGTGLFYPPWVTMTQEPGMSLLYSAMTALPIVQLLRQTAYVPIMRQKDDMSGCKPGGNKFWQRKVNDTHSEVLNRLGSGLRICLWQEGTRSTDGFYQSKSGLKHLWRKIISHNNLVVVPLSSSEDFVLSHGKYRFDISIGKPLRVEQDSRCRLSRAQRLAHEIDGAVYSIMPMYLSHLVSLYYDVWYKTRGNHMPINRPYEDVVSLLILAKQFDIPLITKEPFLELDAIEDSFFSQKALSAKMSQYILNDDYFKSLPHYRSRRILYAANEARRVKGLEGAIAMMVKQPSISL